MKKSTKITLASIFGAGVLMFAGCTAMVGGAVSEVDNAIKADQAEDKRAAEEDVKVTTCVIEETVLGKDLSSRVEITNNGTKRANYLIEGELLTADGNKVGELLASVSNLAPGKSSSQDFGGLFTGKDLASFKAGDKAECALVNVSRDEWSAAND